MVGLTILTWAIYAKSYIQGPLIAFVLKLPKLRGPRRNGIVELGIRVRQMEHHLINDSFGCIKEVVLTLSTMYMQSYAYWSRKNLAARSD